jgi:hypothetical protein
VSRTATATTPATAVSAQRYRDIASRYSAPGLRSTGTRRAVAAPAR